MRLPQDLGLRWQHPATFNIVPLHGLSSNILCDRHNSVLSPLDAIAGQFSQAIGDFDRALLKPKTASEIEKRHIDGNAIERWMLKCLVGMVVCKAFASESLIRRKRSGSCAPRPSRFERGDLNSRSSIGRTAERVRRPFLIVQALMMTLRPIRRTGSAMAEIYISVAVVQAATSRTWGQVLGVLEPNAPEPATSPQ
jgi:hypothetical protein